MSETGAMAALDAGRMRLDGRPPAGPKQRPRDAGTLIIVDEAGPTPRLLMGRRAAGHVFMPGRYVFPGGRVDAADIALASTFTLSEPALARLCAGPPARFDARRATATALAAIRETFEEAGAMVGAPGAFEGRTTGFWGMFAERGIRPDPGQLVPLARAITPPGPPRRYDTRFFCVSATEMSHGPSLEDLPTDELEAVEWFTFDQVKQLSLADITLRVLADLEARIADGSWRDATCPMPFYRAVRGRFVRDFL